MISMPDTVDKKSISVFKEGIEALAEVGGKDVNLCFQCSLCTSSCPWNGVRHFPLRRMLRQAQFGLVELESQDWWLCMTCGLCTSRCPRGVPIIDIMKAVRNVAVSAGMEPASLHSAMASLASLGNPWSQAPEKRTEWTEGMGIKAHSPGTELLYFPCCTSAYEPRARSIARSTAMILQASGVDFGILGAAEVCCGESARKSGYEGLFKNLAGTNIKTFSQVGVTRILTSSPHCYYTFKNEYSLLGGRFEVVHFTEYLGGLLSSGRLKLSKELKARIAYHDPCYLGRHSGIYDAPRQVLQSIPGVELVEMTDRRETSLCCGGGGGRLWQESKKGERFTDIRLAQAESVGADVMATACPYCLVNFDASARDIPEGKKTVQVKDISELVAEAL